MVNMKVAHYTRMLYKAIVQDVHYRVQLKYHYDVVIQQNKEYIDHCLAWKDHCLSATKCTPKMLLHKLG